MSHSVELTICIGEEEIDLTFDLDILPAEPDVGIMNAYVDDWGVDPSDVETYKHLCLTYGRVHVQKKVDEAIERWMLDCPEL